MARKRRLSRVGFYHVLNRGVAKNRIYLDEGDYRKFLAIVEEAGTEYGFELYSFCLMPNHYHLLIETKEENLSRFMQKIASRYTVYFNRKYDRVGPLWQDRFKAYFIYTERKLYTLVRYIEFNLIKAGITRQIGSYPWAMSSALPAIIGNLSTLNYELLNAVSLDTDLSKEELAQIEELYKSKQGTQENAQQGTPPPRDHARDLPPLGSYFGTGQEPSIPREGVVGGAGTQRAGTQGSDTQGNDAKALCSEATEAAIVRAVRDGHRAVEVGHYLGLSKAAISKRSRNYARKEKLFEAPGQRTIRSYRKDLSYEEAGGNLLIEHSLKYADFDDIKLCFELFGKRSVKKVWERRMKSDRRFIKTNLMLARLFFGMDVESTYFKEAAKENGRLEQLR
ncbi:MAG: transposase [Spirochaetia bacterium]|nr:transposase [Spirochaetia bacterium]